MSRKDFDDGVNCTTFGLDLTEKQRAEFDNLFHIATQLKNNFIAYIWKRLYEYANTNAEFKVALDLILEQRNKYGTTVNKAELHDNVKKAYSYMYNCLFNKDKDKRLINLSEYKKEFSKTCYKFYNIYINDNVKSYLLDDAIKGFSKVLSSGGSHTVHYKTDKDTLALRSKAAISQNGNPNNCAFTIIERENNKFYFKCWDLSKKSLKHIFDIYDPETGKLKYNKKNIPNHKQLYIPILYNESDKLQMQILSNATMGAIKLSRSYIRGDWKYYVQINFEKISPVLKSMKFDNHKVAVNVNTEFYAYCRDDGMQDMVELTPTTPRVIEEIKELDRYMDRSRYKMNSKLYDEKGIPLSKEKRKELELQYRYSNGYKRAANKRCELYRTLRLNRTKNNYISAKNVLALGNEFILDKNQYKAWGMKLCRMGEKSKKKYDNGVRVKDYTKQIHDRAPGTFTARIKSVCAARNIPCTELLTFNSSTYNHITQQDDLFLKLNQRLTLLPAYKNENIYNDKVFGIKDTLVTIKGKHGEDLVLQRDVYGAAKMLFIKRKSKIVVDENTKEKKKVRYDWFDQKAFDKWFDDVFYPKHIEFLQKLVDRYNVGEEMSGLILGIKR